MVDPTPKEPAKFVQIALARSEDDALDGVLVALDDRGVVWRYIVDTNEKVHPTYWQELTDVRRLHFD